MILVTGSSGFLGRNLCAELKRQGVGVLPIDKDTGHWLQQYAEKQIKIYHTDYVAYDCGVKAIVHLAAHSQVGWCWEHPQTAMDNNLSATHAAIALATALEVPIIISTSDKVYAGGDIVYDEGSPLHGICPYSKSKVACDQLASAVAGYSRSAKIRIIRFGNLIGSDDHNEARLFPAIRRAVKTGEPMKYLRRDSVRCWLDVSDAVAGIMAVWKRIDMKLSPVVVNMAGKPYSVGEIIAEFERQLGYALPADDKAPLFAEASRLVVNSDLAREAYGWTPTVSLGQTVAKCLKEWKVK